MSANNYQSEVIFTELDERKKKILGAIIENYIETAEPVGSRTISKMSELGVSSATIRNEMADLEDMGLLEQPHTSAGRVPSRLGYRVYVDKLMRKYELSANELNKLSSLMELKIAETESMLREITNIYSHFSNYTVIGISPSKDKGYIKNFHMVPIDLQSALLIVVTDKNIVRNKKIHFEKPIDAKTASTISASLNNHLAGVTNDKISLDILSDLKNDMFEYKSVIIDILDFINECMDMLDENEVYLNGITNILNFPEYKDVQRAKELIEFLEDKNNLHKAVACAKDKKVKIIIGDENEAIELKDCSVVLSSYKMDGRTIGTIGLIGPTRMNYKKAISNLEFLTKQLESIGFEAESEEKT